MSAPERLREARAHVEAALAVIDDLAPELPEPERGALVGVMGSRHDLSRIVRQLGTLATTTAMGAKR